MRLTYLQFVAAGRRGVHFPPLDLVQQPGLPLLPELFVVLLSNGDARWPVVLCPALQELQQLLSGVHRGPAAVSLGTDRRDHPLPAGCSTELTYPEQNKSCLVGLGSSYRLVKAAPTGWPGLAVDE